MNKPKIPNFYEIEGTVHKTDFQYSSQGKEFMTVILDTGAKKNNLVKLVTFGEKAVSLSKQLCEGDIAILRGRISGNDFNGNISCTLVIQEVEVLQAVDRLDPPPVNQSQTVKDDDEIPF